MDSTGRGVRPRPHGRRGCKDERLRNAYPSLFRRVRAVRVATTFIAFYAAMWRASSVVEAGEICSRIIISVSKEAQRTSGAPVAERPIALPPANVAECAMPRPPEKKPPFIPTDITSIVCRHCGGKSRLVRHEPLAADVEGEMLTFECEKCGKQSKAIVQD
jgi:hypothetical protein